MSGRGVEKAFYLRPLQNYEKKRIWFCNVPLRRHKLPGMVRCIMNQEGVSGYFTNHSLQATAVSRLLREGVDEKLIKRVTAL